MRLIQAGAVGRSRCFRSRHADFGSIDHAVHQCQLDSMTGNLCSGHPLRQQCWCSPVGRHHRGKSGERIQNPELRQCGRHWRRQGSLYILCRHRQPIGSVAVCISPARNPKWVKGCRIRDRGVRFGRLPQFGASGFGESFGAAGLAAFGHYRLWCSWKSITFGCSWNSITRAIAMRPSSLLIGTSLDAMPLTCVSR